MHDRSSLYVHPFDRWRVSVPLLPCRRRVASIELDQRGGGGGGGADMSSLDALSLPSQFVIVLPRAGGRASASGRVGEADIRKIYLLREFSPC